MKSSSPPPTRQEPRIEGPEGPFADQVEWMNHRLDPGHYLGGTLRPEFRPSIGHGARRVAAVLVFLSGLVVFGFAIARRDPVGLLGGLLGVLVGWRLWRFANRGESSWSIGDGIRLLFRVVGTTAIGAIVIALVVAALLAAVALPVLVMHGHEDLLAVAAVLVIVAVQLRARSEAPEETP
jgi:hypothetical protein